RPPMDHLNSTGDGAQCVLTSTTSNPAMYAGEWLAAIPIPFHVEGGPELRAAVAAVTARLTAALGAAPDNTRVAAPDNTRFAAPDNTRFAAPDNTRFAAPDNTRLSLPAERYLGGLLDVALEGGGAGPGRRRQTHLEVVVDHDGLPGTVRACIAE